MDARIDLDAASRDSSSPSSSSKQAVLAGTAHRPVGGQRQTGRRIGDARPQAPVQPEISGPQAVPEAPASRRFSRRRMAPTHRVEHAVESCPDCDPVSGGLDPSHPGGRSAPGRASVFIARLSPLPAQLVPPAELDGAALGKQRLGVNLDSRSPPCEEGRLPIPAAPSTSCASAVAAIHRMAQQARPAVSGIVERERGAHSTPMRPAGRTAPTDVWTFSTPTLLPAAWPRQVGGG